MHRIFSSHDIVVRISSLVEDNGDLYSLACINKLVSKAALDVLWNDITLDTYLYLFRQELAPLGDAQVKVRHFYGKPRDWEAWTFYFFWLELPRSVIIAFTYWQNQDLCPTRTNITAQFGIQPRRVSRSLSYSQAGPCDLPVFAQVNLEQWPHRRIASTHNILRSYPAGAEPARYPIYIVR